MSEENTNPNHDLEVIATKEGKHYKLEMCSSDWYNFLKHKKKKGFKYLSYQKGFSQYKLESNEPK